MALSVRKASTQDIHVAYEVYSTCSNDWMIHSLLQSPRVKIAFLRTEGFHANPGRSKRQGEPKGSEMVDTSYMWNPILNTELTNP